MANSYIEKLSIQEVIYKEKEMLTLLFLFVLFVALPIASFLWGYNSCDGINSPEWERRQRWFGWH
jgi:hypothetical protein